MITRTASSALLATLAAAAASAQAAPRPMPAQPPALVVFITVDQLREDYLVKYAPQFTGGLARLVRGGAFFTNAMLDYATTETAPGHSTGMSGRFPSHTGIVSNTLGVFDPESPVIGNPRAFASPFRFRGGALIDWLRMKDPRSRAISVSRKDRGAILPLGRSHQEVYWYDGSNGTFTTSTWYTDTLPPWLRALNARRLPAMQAGKVWTPLLPDSAYAEKDSVVFEN
ncbi:MAG TPA: alkaline phosphatase family protein, partial [Gemmatimonadaceae bacterium]|nr:alkaline phosphatase family protein [Gemmatimonadaceae bacterium]